MKNLTKITVISLLLILASACEIYIGPSRDDTNSPTKNENSDTIVITTPDTALPGTSTDINVEIKDPSIELKPLTPINGQLNETVKLADPKLDLSNAKIVSPSAPIVQATIAEAFKLVSGQPPYADPDPIIYNGPVNLKGWMVMEPFYVGPETVAHFVVAPDNQNLLPEFLKGKHFWIKEKNNQGNWQDISQAMLDKLSKSSSANPLTVTAENLQVIQEGSPWINISSVK